MTERDDRLLELAKSLADSDAIDWERALKQAGDGEERALVERLRAIGAHAALHRTRSKRREDTRGDSPLRAAWGPLELVEKIGEGATAEVFHARDPHLYRDVALKLFRRGEPVPPALTQTVLDEGRHLARVRHENVVAVYGADEHGGRVGLWMELVRGKTLASLVAEQGPYGAGECSVIGIALARALASVHLQQLVHGDVKAQNVMREAGGRIVLMDFSTSRGIVEEPSSTSSDPTGTPLYMAPELWKGAPPSVESDIYALGVLLFHLATGRFPVWGPTLTELERAQERGERKLLRDERPDLPEGFVRVVEKALSREPEHRFASAGAFADALQRQDDAAGDVAVAPLPREVRALAALARAGAVAATILAALLVLGFVTSAAYDVTLGRTGAFATDSPGDWLAWGARSLVLPLVQMLLVAAVVVLVAALYRLWRPAEKAPQRESHPARQARILLLAGLGALAAIYWWYADFLGAVTSLFGESVDPQALALLAPDNRGLYLSYRRVLAVFLLVLGYGFFRVVRGARAQRRRMPWAELAPTALVGLAALLLMTFPWRLMSHSELERAELAGEPAYVIGETASDVLLFLPSARGPKNRVVPRDDPSLTRLGWVESVFSTAREP